MISPQEMQIVYDACCLKANDNETLDSTRILAESATHVRVQATYRNDTKPHLLSIKTFDIEVAQGREDEPS